MLQRLRYVLWTASVPLALTYLLAQPRVVAQEQAQPSDSPPVVAAETGGEHAGEGADEHEHFVTNPIQNFATFDYRGKNAEGGELQEGQHKMPPPFSAQVFNFLVFGFLIWRMGGQSVKRSVRERSEEIARNLAESAKLRDEAKARLDEYTRKMASLDGEIQQLVSGIRAEAEAERKRIIAEAEGRAERMQRDAEQQIQAEMQRVRATLEREAVVAAVNIAERLLQEKTGDADQRQLADKFVKGLSETAGIRRPRA